MGSMSYPEFPRQLKIEPVYGCNRKCAFCSLSNEGDELVFMNERTFDRILSACEDGVVKQVGVSIHGEPTMHPMYIEWVKALREKLPNARILTFTNGYRFEQEGDLGYLSDMLDAGATHIHVDLYDSTVAGIFLSGVRAFEGRAHVANGYEENVWTSTHKKLISYLPIRQALMLDTQTQREFNTQGGATKYENWMKYGLNPANLPALKTCKELNKYLTITAEGYGKICCADGSRSLYLGNVNEMSIREMWTSEKADMIRYALHRGRRDLIPSCYTCDRPSFRDALWPHWGKQYPLTEIRAMLVRELRGAPDFMRNMRKLNEDFPITAEPLASYIKRP